MDNRKQFVTRMACRGGIAFLLLIGFHSALAQTYTIKTFAGGALPNNILGTSASLSAPQGVAIDAAGNVFFASQNAVFRLAAVTGVLTRVAGNGALSFSGDNGPATSASLSAAGIAVDSSGNRSEERRGRE